MKKYLFIAVIAVLTFVYWDVVYYPSSICADEVEIVNEINADIYINLYPGSYKNDTLWATRDLAVYKYDESSGCFVFSNRLWFPISTRQVLWNSRSLRTLFGRTRVGSLYTLDSGTQLFFAGAHIYRSENSEPFRIVKKRESGIMRSGVTEDNEGNVYYGVYTTDPNKENIDIYIGKSDGEDWELFYRFSEGAIRHIHGVHYDSYRDLVWITTGDRDDESKIGYFHADDNTTFTKIGIGSQDWRAVSLLIDEQYIYWGMDSPSVQCYIYRYDLEMNEKEKLQPIDGPAYYTAKLDDGSMLLTTTVEGGPGELNNNVSIWITSDGEQWERYIEIEEAKDRKGFAIASVPTGDPAPFKVFHFINTNEYKNALLILNSSDD